MRTRMTLDRDQGRDRLAGLTRLLGAFMGHRAKMMAACALGLMPGAAIAAETITYTYDAKGRVIKVERSGTVNNGVDTDYSYDDAENRTNKTTTGSPNSPPP